MPIRICMLALLVFTGMSCMEDPEPVSIDWWNMPAHAPAPELLLNNQMSQISVDGNKFVNEEGQQIVFRGVNISDPDKLVKNGKWQKSHFEVIKEWGADIVRIPIHPTAWRERGDDAYLLLLDEAVEWANDLELYLIFDWHSIGNLRTGLFQHPMYQTSMQETSAFWRTISSRYAGITTVAFYEIFNEPTRYNGQLGSIEWAEWKQMVEEFIGIIYAHDDSVIPLVTGFNWGYDLRPVFDHPIDAEGIGYVAHPYPQKTSPWEENWERDFGFVADNYPMIATEIGFMDENDEGAHIPVISGPEYGEAVSAYFDQKGISWTVWCFDPDWPPQMIADWSYTPTVQGALFRTKMLER